MHPVDMIFFWARSNPEQPSLIQSDLVLTYRELAEAIDSVSGRILQYNFNKQEPVAVSIHQPIQKLVVCFALMRCGISVAPVNQDALPFLRANGISNVIYTGEGLMLSGGRNIRFEDSWLRSEGKFSPVSGPAHGNHVTHAETVFIAADVAGRLPKKTIVPSGALLATVRSLPLVGDTKYGRLLIVSSVNSPFGFGRVASSLYAGKTACFAAGYEAQVLLIDAFDIETISCSVQQASELINLIEKNGGSEFGSLKEVWIDSGIATKDLIKKVQTHLCRNVIVGYSSDEAGRIAFANLDAINDVPNAVGFVTPYARVEIVDENDRQVSLGKEGRVRCNTEYFSKVFAANNPGQAIKAENVWWYPGVLGRLNSDGMLCIRSPTA